MYGRIMRLPSTGLITTEALHGKNDQMLLNIIMKIYELHSVRLSRLLSLYLAISELYVSSPRCLPTNNCVHTITLVLFLAAVNLEG